MFYSITQYYAVRENTVLKIELQHLEVIVKNAHVTCFPEKLAVLGEIFKSKMCQN